MQIDVKVKRGKDAPIGPGLKVVAADGTVYVTVGPRGSTLRRQDPKVKGKAARKADKRRRLESRKGV